MASLGKLTLNSNSKDEINKIGVKPPPAQKAKTDEEKAEEAIKEGLNGKQGSGLPSELKKR